MSSAVTANGFCEEMMHVPIWQWAVRCNREFNGPFKELGTCQGFLQLCDQLYTDNCLVRILNITDFFQYPLGDG